MLVLLLCLGVILPVCTLGANAQTDPASIAAHDLHQGLLIAVDPYTSAARYKDKFGKHTPYDGGVLAVEIYLRNDNDSPIRITTDTIRLMMGAPGESKQRLEPLSPEDVADRVLLTPGKEPNPRRSIPFPGSTAKTGRDKTWNDMANSLRSASLTTDVIPAHTTAHGFLYFDINHHYDWLSNARLDIPDLTFTADNKALFFFQIELAPPASSK